MDTTKLYTPDEAATLGFDIPRSEVLAATGWSKATLGRRMDPENGELKLGRDFVYCKGRTKNTPQFNHAALKLAGIHVATAEPVSDLEFEISDNEASREQGSDPRIAPEPPVAPESTSQALVTHNSSLVPVKTRDKVQADALAIIELLKVKLYLTIEEAVLMSGLPPGVIRPSTTLKGGRRLIHREELAKL